MTTVSAMQVMHSSASSSHQQAPASTAPVLEFVCLFTHDLRRKQKRWQDGILKFHTYNKRIMVHDEPGNFVGDAHWRADYDLDDGEELQLERGGTIVQVGECKGSRDQDLSDLVDKRAQAKAERQAAALARRRPTQQPATPSAATPQFQPLHKPLHRLIGTPTGHHGRALIPAESPYEERQKLAESPQNDDNARPAKRPRRELSPPSKSGYARSLFGTTLTLSGTPSSTPTWNKPPRSSPILGDSQAAKAPHPAPYNNKSDPSPKLADTTPTSDLPNEKRVKMPKARLLKNIPQPQPEPEQRATEPGSPSFPLEVDSAPAKGQNSVTDTRQLGSKRKEISSRARNTNLMQPTAANKTNPSRSRGKHTLSDDASSPASIVDEEVDTSLPTRSTKTPAPDRSRFTGPRPKKTAEPPNPNEEEQDVTREQTMDEPRTELRIRPRKKRGLLMISENLNVDNLPGPKRTKSRTDRPSSSTLNNDSRLEGAGTAFGTEKSTSDDVRESDRRRLKKRNVVDSFEENEPELSRMARVDLHDSRNIENDDVPPTKPRNKRGIEPRGGVSETKNLEVAPNISSHPNQDDSSDETVPKTKRSRVNRQARSPSPAREGSDLSEPVRSPKRRKQPPRKNKLASARNVLHRHSEEENDNEEQNITSEDEDPFPNGIPPPRLAKLGRKSIRSREVIGFMFDEDDYGSAPPRSKGRAEDNQQDLTVTHPRGQSVLQPPTPATECIDPVTTNNDRVTTAAQVPPDQPPPNNARKVDNTTTKSLKDHGASTSCVEPIPLHQTEKQNKLESTHSISEPVVQKQAQRPVRMVSNPATRGKKAAKPSDAAGHVPQCPLPSEVAVGKPLENSRQRSRPENRPKESTPAPMPGFSRANGGPWSREAYDLFEFTRPS